ncbi:MAG: hypothetical protein LBR44_03110 [Clostridiales Family XIII bacterium]|nr:hypothetical protein [Clostridiales Family XIII bacterium]
MKKYFGLLVLLLAVLLALASCFGGPRAGTEPPASSEGIAGSSEDEGGSESAALGTIDAGELNPYLEGHLMPLAGNPVAGEYITTSGVKLSIGEDGSYLWDERPVGGTYISGRYELYEGTAKGNDDGSTEYVFESDTGPVYTMVIDFDDTGDGLEGADMTIQVYDWYTADVYRVTDLLYQTQFEATRQAAAGSGEWSSFASPENLTIEFGDGTDALISWDPVAGADGYMIAVLPMSMADLEAAVTTGAESPDPVFNETSSTNEIAAIGVMKPGETYTVAVVATRGSEASGDMEASYGAYEEVTAPA